MSNEERVSWGALIVNGVFGIAYCYMLSMPADADPFDLDGARFPVPPMFAAVILGIACEIVLRRVQRATGEKGDLSLRDERDTLIRLKATRNAYGVLVAFMFVLVVLFVQVDLAHYRPGRGEPDTILELLLTGPLEARHFGLMMLAPFLLSFITLHASRIFYSRRGY